MMKYLIIILLFFNFNLFSQIDHFYWAKEMLRIYAPSEWEHMMSYDSLDQNLELKSSKGGMTLTISTHKPGPTWHYLDAGNKLFQLSSISTNCHEINHSLTHLLSYKYPSGNLNFADKRYYFRLPNKKRFQLHSSVKFFPSISLVDIIPPNLRTFRYKSYINTTSISCYSDGLLGLLDEYNAYLHSFATMYWLRPAYMTVLDDELMCHIKWRNSIMSEELAYYEFNYFILEYFLLAKSQNGAVWKAIKETNIVEIYNAITENYKQMVEMYDEDRTKDKTAWASKGVKYSFDGNTEWFHRDGYGQGVVKFKDITVLKEHLAGNKYDELIKELCLLRSVPPQKSSKK